MSPLRAMISLAMSQTIDTLVFYGLMSFFEDLWGNVWHVIAFTLLIKFVIIFLVAPYTAIAHYFVKKTPASFGVEVKAMDG